MSFFSSKKNVITHSGSFHPDEVFAVACISLIEKDFIKIRRTRKKDIIENADYVVDVGGICDFSKNRFDHHQEGGAGERDNKVPYASFGLVWKKYGQQICGDKKLSEIIDKKFVQGIDLIDNGVGEIKPIFADVFPLTLSDVIMAMNPTKANSNESFDNAFDDALKIAKKILLNILKNSKYELETKEFFKKSYERSLDKRLVVLEESFPWFETVIGYKDVLFVVEPDINDFGEKNWKVKCARDNVNNFINRKDLPESWAGKRDVELSKITGISDVIFCHNKRFVAVTKTKEGAIALAKLALSFGS